MVKLTDKECEVIWESSTKENPLKLDERGMEVMKWVDRKNRGEV